MIQSLRKVEPTVQDLSMNSASVRAVEPILEGEARARNRNSLGILQPSDLCSLQTLADGSCHRRHTLMLTSGTSTSRFGCLWLRSGGLTLFGPFPNPCSGGLPGGQPAGA